MAILSWIFIIEHRNRLQQQLSVLKETCTFTWEHREQDEAYHFLVRLGGHTNRLRKNKIIAHNTIIRKDDNQPHVFERLLQLNDLQSLSLRQLRSFILYFFLLNLSFKFVFGCHFAFLVPEACY